ncbi:hypothetical protein [Micromonospora inositola]|uniref:hypothetical protein n=1 Tax=Micromonospora inositola TaxID=47865 RepID=UPI0012FE772A|nr:hypothetical protein [Micromonospora inositola]
MIGLLSQDRSLHDVSLPSRRTIVPRLLSVPGVANVAVWGFRDRQPQAQVDPAGLTQHGAALDQVLRTSANTLWVSPPTSWRRRHPAWAVSSTPPIGA